MAAATTPSPRTGTSQFTCALSSVTEAEANRSGSTRGTPSSAIEAAPVIIPPQVSATGGSASPPSAADVAADRKK